MYVIQRRIEIDLFHPLFMDVGCLDSGLTSASPLATPTVADDFWSNLHACLLASSNAIVGIMISKFLL